MECLNLKMLLFWNYSFVPLLAGSYQWSVYNPPIVHPSTCKLGCPGTAVHEQPENTKSAVKRLSLTDQQISEM